jgi:hypothetical protein
MNIPDYGDPIIRLQRRIQELELVVQALKAGSNRPTIPIYSPQDLSDFVEQNDGEFWINSSDSKMYYRINGNASKVTST